MISNSDDLLKYISDNKGFINLSDGLHSDLKLDQDTLEMYFNELVSCGYIKRNIRSYILTPAGRDYLNP